MELRKMLKRALKDEKEAIDLYQKIEERASEEGRMDIAGLATHIEIEELEHKEELEKVLKFG